MSADSSGIPRRSVSRPASRSGQSLATGELVEVTIRPAEAGAGVCFHHLPTGAVLPSNLAHVVDTPQCTALAAGETRIEFVEHLLAVLLANEITDAIIDVDGGEVPLIDGSASSYQEMVAEAQPVALDGEVMPVELDRVIEHAADGKAIIAFPGALQFWYRLDYGHPLIGRQCACFDPAADDFAEDIAPARTFSTEQEARALIEARNLEGADIAMSIIAFDDRLSAPEPVPASFAKHKIIDLMGDLYLLGRPLRARVIAHRTGHTENRALARKIAEAYQVS